MALGVVYLKDGPCDGRTHTLTNAEAKANQVVCKGWLYQFSPAAGLHDGDEIFIATGPYVAPGKIGKAAHAHGGWNDLRRAFNHTMPASLRSVKRANRAALRSVARARKVRL